MTLPILVHYAFNASRKHILTPSVLDLNAVVADLGKMLPRLIGEHIEMRLLAKAEFGRIEADRGQIEQILMNMAVNARDAMPAGGTLVIEVKDTVFENTHTGTGYNIPPGAYVMLAVSDTGMGMDAETQAHILEPFFTTKERGKGTGLGLATVYGIVKQSGGYISVYSGKGVGTTFKMYFPRAEKELTPQRVHAPAQAAAGGSETNSCWWRTNRRCVSPPASSCRPRAMRWWTPGVPPMRCGYFRSTPAACIC